MNVIFLDIDGVLNCEIFYKKSYKEVKKELKKDVKKGNISRNEYYYSQLCSERIEWLNNLCKEVNAKVVISSTWRMGKTVEQLQDILNYSGATFEIIGVTPNLRSDDCLRGNEIYRWIKDNSEELFGISYFDFKTYAIIDDDSDMLLWQKDNFFQTDAYSGLTPTTCYKINRFFKKFNSEPAAQESDTTNDK